MFGLGFQELIVIGILALLILGPKKLPELARTVGKVVREFQRAADDVKKEINTAALDDEPLKQVYPPRPPAPDPSAKAYGLVPEPNPLDPAPEPPSNSEKTPEAPSAIEARPGDAPAETPPAAGPVAEPGPESAAADKKDPGPSPRAGDQAAAGGLTPPEDARGSGGEVSVAVPRKNDAA